jgi:hypothetical protein
MLTIDRLVVRGKVPRRANLDRTLIGRITPAEFGVECSRQLNRPWPVQARVARIRQLRVRLSIPASQLQPDTFIKAWTEAFIRELFAALAHLHNVEIIQFQSRAEYVAAVIRDLLNSVAGQRWAYKEFEHLFNTGTSEAILSLFRRERTEIIPILLTLQDWGLLDRLLALWDDAGFEQFFLILEGESRIQIKKPTIEELIWAARLLLGRPVLGIEPLGGSSLAQGKIVVKLLLHSVRQSDSGADRMILPGTLFRALRILGLLVDRFNSPEQRRRLIIGSRSLSNELIPSDSTLSVGTSLTRDGIPVAATDDEKQIRLIELLDRIRLIASGSTPEEQEFNDIVAAGNAESRIAFAELFKQLLTGTDIGDDSDGAAKSKWISTDCAGLFLLVRVLDRLGWEDGLARSSLTDIYGTRLITYALAGIASAVLGQFSDEQAYIEPGIALFSGWMDTPDLRGFRAFLAAGSVETRRGLLQELLSGESAFEYSASWQTCFGSLASHLIQEFTEHIRCFGKPSRSFVVKNFVALPGRIRIEEKRLVVVFTSNPLHVVIHLSGLDDPVEPVRWLGGRRIEFQANGI